MISKFLVSGDGRALISVDLLRTDENKLERSLKILDLVAKLSSGFVELSLTTSECDLIFCNGEKTEVALSEEFLLNFTRIVFGVVGALELSRPLVIFDCPVTLEITTAVAPAGNTLPLPAFQLHGFRRHNSGRSGRKVPPIFYENSTADLMVSS